METKSIAIRYAKLRSSIASMAALIALAAFSAVAQPTTGVLLETWSGIGGIYVSDLTSNPAYPNNPTTRTYPNIFETQTNLSDNYGTRVRAFVTAPTSGSYTFWISGDDFCELWLSTDANPANIRRIANVPGWTSPRLWTKYPEQVSAPVTLTGGQRYFIETRHKEGTGGDNLAVGWQGPGISGDAERPIPGTRLAPWSDAVAPTITTQPANRTVNMGQTAAFTVAASGTATLTYQWRRNGVNISGATAASYTTPPTLEADNGALYSVVVANSVGSVTSANAVLTIIVPPVITTQPANSTVSVGLTATFSVAATGTAPVFQWRKNGVNIAGATSPAYTTPATVAADNGAQFSVVISNAAGTVTSANAILTVNSAPVITTQPANRTVNLGQTATFSVVATGSALAFQWRRNGVSISGATATSYTTPATVAADNGAQFSVVVSNASGSVTSASATLTVISPPIITSQPANASILAGQTASFSVTATGSAPLAYQWRKNGVAITGATGQSYTTPVTVPADNGSLFTVLVSNPAATATSSAAVLTVVFVAPNNRKIAVSGELVDVSGNPLGFPTPVNVNASVRLMTEATGGTAVYSEEFRASDSKAILVENGLFVARLGEGVTSQNLQQVIGANASLWVEITIDDGTPDVLAPRTPLTAAGWSLGGTPAAGLASAGMQGAGNPGSLGVEATVGTTYVNTLDNTTWFRLSTGWKLMD